MSQWAAVQCGRAAASPVVADPAGQRLAAFVQAQAIYVSVGVAAAIDDRRSAEFGPFLPGHVGDPVGRRAFIGTVIAAAAAGQGQPQDADEQENCWQPKTVGVERVPKARLPANMNSDEGPVDTHV